MLKYLDSTKKNFIKKLELDLSKRSVSKSKKFIIVKKIIIDVKKNKDKAVLKYEKKFSKSKKN